VQIAVAATPEVALPTLEALLKSEHNLVSVITQPDRPAGRGLSLKESPVAIWAKDRGISVRKPVDQEELKLAVADVDLVITIGFGVIIKAEILDLPKHGFINLHFSLLPKWRGAAPVQRAIEAGDEVTGVTVFKLDKGMDTGPIYRQKEIAMPHQATTQSLLQDLAVVGAPVVLDAISAIEANGASCYPILRWCITRRQVIEGRRPYRLARCIIEYRAKNSRFLSSTWSMDNFSR
jgi:methionyl-tRNA formyltransferase